MPVVNIIDTRTNENNTNCDVVFEIFDNKDKHITHWMEYISVGVAVEVAAKYVDNVTVYLYDGGKVREDFNIMPAIHPLIHAFPIWPKDFR